MLGIVKNEKDQEVERVIMPSYDWIVEHLEKNICIIFFRKRLNGRFRSIRCTRDFTKLPKKYKSKYLQEGIENPHGINSIIPVWETSSREWKSFYYENLLSITVYTGAKL